MKFYVAFATVLLLSTAACLSQATETPMAERPRVNPGDVFVYADRFETVACKRWEVKELNRGGYLTTRCNDNTAYFTTDGALVRIVGKDGQDLVKFTPQSAAIPFPLQVGAKWHGKFEVTTASEIVTPTISETCEAVAFEPVKVAAGELMAFRVNCSDSWSVGLLSGSSASTLWYAPDAKAVVKVISTGDDKWNLELTGYSFK